jgi:hypothetical protein
VQRAFIIRMNNTHRAVDSSCHATLRTSGQWLIVRQDLYNGVQLKLLAVTQDLTVMVLYVTQAVVPIRH